MKIRFKASDPRAGTVAQMDSSRGQHFIDIGAAVLVKEGGNGAETVVRAELDKALTGLPGGHTDANYVVGAMRSHFGDVFTDADEAKVREVVKLPPASVPVQTAVAAKPDVPSDAEPPAGEQKTKKTADTKKGS